MKISKDVILESMEVEVEEDIENNKESIINDGANFYGLHVKYRNNCLDTENPHISIGWSAIGDLTTATVRPQLEELYDKVFVDKFQMCDRIHK